MVKKKPRKPKKQPLSKSPGKRSVVPKGDGYKDILESVVGLLASARRVSARVVNSVMTATYWEIGRRIVEWEQGGKDRAEYGEELIPRLATDLTKRLGRGYSQSNLKYMRQFFELWPIRQTLSGESDRPAIRQTPSGESQVSTFAESAEYKTQTVSAQLLGHTTESVRSIRILAEQFPLSWSHYVQLLSVSDDRARRFYEAEALRGGWSVRQLKRQIDSQFYERALLSKNKAAVLRKGEKSQSEDEVSADEEIRDPFVLEFLGLKDEYSESDLEEALIAKLEEFLLELGSDFTFVGRQKRLRIGDDWYRIDLLFYHRRLRCLVVIDLKIGKFTHADAGQMHMYLNYAAEHWTHADENPPVGLILCARHDESLAKYALDNLPNKVMAREYKLALPDEQLLIDELERTQRALEHRTPKTEN